MKKVILSAVILIGISLLAAAVFLLAPERTGAAQPQPFDGERAYQDVQTQVDFGPRVPGSPAHGKTVEWIRSQAQNAGWSVEIQETERLGHPVRNIIAKRGSGKPWIILGAHYDSRMAADQDSDPVRAQQPVDAANDGASGVAVLLELARVLPENLDQEVWLAFFDTEDQGNLPGWDWILGSRALAESLTELPDAVVVVDMIGDSDLNIYMERNSDRAITEEIWNVADMAGYGDQFIPTYRHSMLDDHTPFLERGIRAIDIIDFDYPYWHTGQDTPDKVSAESLEAVGETLRRWLVNNPLRKKD